MRIKKFILAYPERIILVVALIGLFVHGVKTFNAPPDPDVERINKKLNEIKRVISTNPPLVFPEVKYLETIKSKWDKLASAPELYGGMMFRNTIPLISYAETVVAPKKVILPPIMDKLSVDPELPDRIVISWTKNTEIPIKPLAVISKYRIYRKAAGEKQDKMVTEVKPDPNVLSFAYTDTDNIQPELQYTYYITAFTDEKSDEMTDGKTESIPSVAKQTVTPEIVKLDAIATSSSEQIYMSIEKYIGGKWQKTRDYFKKGDRVGKDKFVTDYEIANITEETVNKSIDPSDPLKTVKKTFFRITLKHVKTGKEIVRETKPVTR
ncbi:MAG: fibronectin type III domain-containing protein [Planctomycetes bacterium]|nr:fibronectin type III domain-containing protein [Planctomycetota bacterium]